jgi:hypothetical protein
MDKGDPEPMPLPKRASKVDPEEIYSFEGNFSTENRSYARSAQDVATPKLGCGILGSLSVSSENTEDKNSPPLTGTFDVEKRAQGQVAPQVPVKRAHGSRGSQKWEPHNSEENSTGDQICIADENSSENGGEGQLLDVQNPLHVTLLEFGMERLIPHANEFFTRMRTYNAGEIDMEIMEVINNKMARDEIFGYWVRERMHQETVQEANILLLEEGGTVEPPHVHDEELSYENRRGHSDFDPRGGGAQFAQPSGSVFPPGSKT